jgi:cellulose synthase/poly-beta-1,6-N-acetylglucosamine synthase-like glycosyltransferase
MRLAFWFSFGFILYVYVGYPILLVLVRRVARRSVRKAYIEPSVTLVIAAHNEGEKIAAKLENCLALDYPRKKLQIVVSLDGPTDGTEEIVRSYASEGIELVYSKEHYGKASALNRAVARAVGEIVVFADVRQTFSPTVLRELAANFADESVGAVTGELLLAGEGSAGVGLYWRYEKAIRAMESDIHSVVGTTGAIYAIRRELFRELPAGTLLDDVVVPMRIVLGGKRVIFDRSAEAYDLVSCCPRAEYRKKVRTLAGNYQLMATLPQVLAPWRNPIFVQFVSHKVARLLVPYAMAALFIANIALLGNNFYSVIFALQAFWYALAAAGAVYDRAFSRNSRDDTQRQVAPREAA